jgi:hypothetical protein
MKKEEFKAEIGITTKEKIEEDTNKTEAKITSANEVSKQCIEGLINMESFEPLSLGVIKKI